MSASSDTVNMALFCDFENVALGVRDAKYAKFDINKVLERLLLKGSIVLKKAYCDWERYKEFKSDMHEASFELIEIPHVRMSGKNSADIRMGVDAEGKIWGRLWRLGSKRGSPGSTDSSTGFRCLWNLLDQAEWRRMLQFGPMENPGAFLVKGGRPKKF